MTRSIKQGIKKAIHALGIDVVRFKTKKNPLAWAREYNIKTVIDIGANVGQFAREIRDVLPEAMIYSFEPVQGTYEQLVEEMKSDAYFKAFPYALGEKEETVSMHINVHSPSSSLLPLASAHKDTYPTSLETATETIQVRRLDTVVKEFTVTPNLLVKFDAQGFERHILAGGRETVAQAKVVLMELCFKELYEGQALFEELHTTLTELGFTYAGGINTKLGKDGMPLFEDGVFIRA